MRKLVLTVLAVGAACLPAISVAAERFSTPIIVGDSWSNDYGDWPNFTTSVTWSEFRHHAIAGEWLSVQDAASKVGMAANIVAYLDQHPEADSIIIEGGINDILNGIDAETLKSALQLLVAEARTRKNIVDIIVMAPGPMGAVDTWSQARQNELEEYLSWLPGFCENQAITFYNTYAAVGHFSRPLIISDGSYGSPDYDADGLHVNQTGAARIANDIDFYIETIRSGPMRLNMDVDPWSDANEVLPASNIMIPVAIMGGSAATGEAFDATQINHETLEFGLGNAPNMAVPWVADIDRDADVDALYGFRTEDSGVYCGDTVVTLAGETYAGDEFTAVGTINTSDCVSEGCHP